SDGTACCCMGEVCGDDNDKWELLCNRCHNDDSEAPAGACYSKGQPGKWAWIHHDGTDAPYPNPKCCSKCHHGGGGGGGGGGGECGHSVNPINCICCHYHGSTVNNTGGHRDEHNGTWSSQITF
ncbi:MAG: hypothetical protein V1753_09760, partial [Pseudomonadota bacterium]